VKPRRRESVPGRPDRIPVGTGTPPGARVDARLQGRRPRLPRQHRREQHDRGHDPRGDREESADGPQNLRRSFESSIPEIWLDWEESTDDTDPQSLIPYEVFINGVLNQLGTTIGAPETVAYCQGSGLNTIKIRAVDTSGNASAFGNEITFC
jgi:hypothetical protein